MSMSWSGGRITSDGRCTPPPMWLRASGRGAGAPLLQSSLLAALHSLHNTTSCYAQSPALLQTSNGIH